MQRRHFWLSILFCFSAVLCGCGNALDEFSHRPCRVVIDNSLHNDATLASAMNSQSKGVFCVIRETIQGGAHQYSFSTNYGQETSVLLNAIEIKQTRIIGMNNGVIVGFGNLDEPAIFYAYDRECPNCFNPYAIPIKSKPLNIDEKGWATCRACNRIYDLNNRGFIIDGDKGQPLIRYRASTTGPFGVLSVY